MEVSAVLEVLARPGCDRSTSGRCRWTSRKTAWSGEAGTPGCSGTPAFPGTPRSTGAATPPGAGRRRPARLGARLSRVPRRPEHHGLSTGGPQRPYRLRVYRSPDVPGPGAPSVTDLASGEATVIRDLMHPSGPARARRGRAAPAAADAGYLRRPMVWSEVFADCDAPSVVVRWSDLSGDRPRTASIVRPEAVRVNYQSHQAGGCANTSVRRDGGAFCRSPTPRGRSRKGPDWNSAGARDGPVPARARLSERRMRKMRSG